MRLWDGRKARVRPGGAGGPGWLGELGELGGLGEPGEPKGLEPVGRRADGAGKAWIDRALNGENSLSKK